jgi:hypothetical protein
MVFKHLALLAALFTGILSPSASHAQGKPDFSKYEYCVTDDGTFGLYKPKGWKVGTQKYSNSRMVYVTDPENVSYVSGLFLENINPKDDSVTFAISSLKNVIKQMPSLKLLESRSTRDRMQTVVRYQRSGPKGIVIEGKYSFNVKRPAAVVFGYEAPANQFKEMVPTLLTTVANITLFDEQKYLEDASQTKKGQSAVPPMKEVSSQDKMCRLLVPEGWNLSSEKGATVCASPDENAGYIFATVGFVARSRIPYFDSSKMPGIHAEYMRPIDALVVAARHTGSTNHKILERHLNPAKAAEGSVVLKKQVDAEIALISYTNRKGVPCIGYYDVMGSPPDNAGQWGILAMGFWAPESQFARYLASLIQIAESFRINEELSSKYVRDGMAKVQEMMKTTSSMMYRYSQEMRASSLAGHQNRMRSMDYTSYKFSTYMRGQQEWVTGVEGGAIVTTDHWGLSVGGKYVVEGPPFNYYNFQGEKYGLIPVDSSREVFEAVKY